MDGNRSFPYTVDSAVLFVNAIKESPNRYIGNVDCTLDKLPLSDNLVLPFTKNEKEYGNSYICSPYTALVPYCKEELKKVDSYFLQVFISVLLVLVDGLLKLGRVNKVMQVNNWLLSTNLFPDTFSESDISQSINSSSSLQSEYLIMYRSLNDHSNSFLIGAFGRCGFDMLPTRQVYIFDKSLNDYSKHHNYKIDRKLLRETNYKFVSDVDILEEDYPRIVQLYNMLYIDKYSIHNPKFTVNFIALIMRHPNFKLEAFRNEDGVLDAVGGRFEMDGIVTLPIVGYDTTKPKELGLYRIVMISTLLYAESNGLVFNASSGASEFKRLRGAVPFIEYAAIYYQDLPLYRRVLWKWLCTVLKKFFIPIMRRFKL
ncbi:hypothetical protein ACG1BZ_12615 [Microbulbifer sp. CNSA002]|uniref:hypothetical protein n=1 Tax=Microbulbifer sp. CNSA002 TaxID=3373604 RepID=UPI0039B54486